MSDYEIGRLNRNVLIKIVKEQQEIINKTIEIIERNENKAPIEVILNDIGEALKVLKGDK